VPASNDEAGLLAQLLGIVSIFFWVFLVSLLFWFLIRVTLGLRVDEETEYEGVDITECGLEAYPEFTRSE